MPKLSVTIITHNEAAHIAAALESVAWADERIVVDSGSTDETVAIARRHAARVEVREWQGYAPQKNYAASIAAHDWILSLDADERVGVALTDEIKATLASEPSARGYRVPRVTNYLGQWIRSTDWWPDWQLRLYDRRTAQWTRVHVHESVRVTGRVERLRGGFRQGTTGLIVSLLNSYYVLLKFAKLWERQRAALLAAPPAPAEVTQPAEDPAATAGH